MYHNCSDPDESTAVIWVCRNNHTERLGYCPGHGPAMLRLALRFAASGSAGICPECGALSAPRID